MADGLLMQMDGVRELERALNTLPTRVQKRVVRRALAKASTPILKAARAKAPRESGTLRRSLGRRVGEARNVIPHKQRGEYHPKDIVIIVGPRINMGRFVQVGNRKEFRDPINYAHLVENGTAPHAVGQGSRLVVKTKYRERPGMQVGALHPGAAPKPFLRPAFDQNVRESQNILRTEVLRGVEQEAAKLAAKK